MLQSVANSRIDGGIKNDGKTKKKKESREKEEECIDVCILSKFDQLTTNICTSININSCLLTFIFLLQ
jgi:hypothetical protein